MKLETFFYSFVNECLEELTDSRLVEFSITFARLSWLGQ